MNTSVASINAPATSSGGGSDNDSNCHHSSSAAIVAAQPSPPALSLAAEAAAPAAATAAPAAETAAPIASSPRAASSSQRDADHFCCKRVLTVGDGNFSYSLAFAKRFVAPSPTPASVTTTTGSERIDASNVAVQLVATSFDSYDELVGKYPEATRIVAQLRDCGVHVLHRVDATNLRSSLDAAAAADVALDTLDSHIGTSDFDVITFNHPHCGEENVRRHQSLLSHFFVSALDVLRANASSEIHVTLAAGQAERWQAIDRACRAGLILKLQVDDVDNDATFGLAYERKRHQNGKSFHRVLLHGEKLQQQSTLFVFARADADANASVDTIGINAANGISDTKARSKLLLPTSRKRKAQDATESALPTELHETKQQQQQLQHLVPSAGAFACDACDNKSFKTAQGLKTHKHMVHELGHATRTTAVLLPCGVCDRTFKNADAQRQHRLAKHGDDPLIRPDWYQKQQQEGVDKQGDTESQRPTAELTADSVSASTSTASSTSQTKQQQQQLALTCAICDLVFDSQRSLDAHWQDLQPKTVVLRACTRCGRAFDEERALRQHQNFCKAVDVAAALE